MHWVTLGTVRTQGRVRITELERAEKAGDRQCHMHAVADGIAVPTVALCIEPTL